jgi:hypothetical protein
MPSAQSNGSNFGNGINSREIARIQGEIFMAKSFPRDRQAAIQQIEADCSSAKLAEQAVYQYARGGSDITGPSIRLAEVLARCMGNIRYGFEEQDSDDETSIVRSYAYDIQSNAQAERIFRVPHYRYSKSGGMKHLDDPRDIYEMVANQASRRVRACILEIVPGDIVQYALDKCEQTLKTSVNITPDTAVKILESYASYGVTKLMIEARIQRKMDAITPQHVIQLRQILQAIKDGVGKPEDYFDMPSTTTTTQTLAQQSQQPLNGSAVAIPSSSSPVIQSRPTRRTGHATVITPASAQQQPPVAAVPEHPVAVVATPVAQPQMVTQQSQVTGPEEFEDDQIPPDGNDDDVDLGGYGL